MSVLASTVIEKAKSFVGVTEKPANSNNVIFNTHYYGKEVKGSAYPWCAVYIWDVFRLVGASDLYYGGGKCAYTPTLANYYKNKNQWYTSPKVGDLVFYQFKGSNRINHVGLVIEVLSATRIKTIEGNTGSGNDANGGAVMIRERDTTYVKGYARPNYITNKVTTTNNQPVKETVTGYTRTDFIKEVQRALGMSQTGVANETLLSKTVTISCKKNKNHAVVRPVQKFLNANGYNCGIADGIAGNKFDTAMKKYQTWMSKPDGEATAKGKTWKMMLGLIK